MIDLVSTWAENPWVLDFDTLKNYFVCMYIISMHGILDGYYTQNPGT